MSTVEHTEAEAGSVKAAVERLYAALRRGDLEGAVACLHPDAELHEPPDLPYGGVHRGSAEILPVFAQVGPAVDRSTINREAYMEQDGRGIFVMETTTILGEKIRVIEEFLVHDERIARIRIFFWDVGPMNRALAAAASA
jgi:ketosteroid isomerase-like protein